MAAGNIKVIKPGRNYELICKKIIYDHNVTLSALGVFVRVVSLSDKWQLNISRLAGMMEVSEDTIQAAFKNLEKNGYLKRKRIKNEKGHFCGWEYVFNNVSDGITDNRKNRQSEKADDGKNRQSEKPADIIETISISRDYSIEVDTNNEVEKEKEKEARRIRLQTTPDSRLSLPELMEKYGQQ